MNFDLLVQLTKRDISARFKGSLLGRLWVVVNPLFMAALYSFVFGGILKVRWQDAENNSVSYGAFLFLSYIVFGLFAEIVGRGPSLIVLQPNLVKKVVFPLSMLSWSSAFASVTQFLINFFVFLFLALVLGGRGLSVWIALALPFFLIPLIFYSVALSLILAPLTVLFRDLAQVVNLGITVLMYGTPVFYPLARVPESYKWLILQNPLTFFVEGARQIVAGNAFGVIVWGCHLIASIVIVFLATSFQRRLTRVLPDFL